MPERTYAEALPGAQPDAWYGPVSMTGAGLGLCPSCAHQRHENDLCGYRSVAEDGNSITACICWAGKE